MIITNNSIWPIDGALTGTTSPGQGEPGINGNKGLHHIPQGSGIEVLPSVAI